MNNHVTQRLISLLLATVILTSPLIAQQRRNAAPRKPPPMSAEQPPPAEPVPTFDTLLAAETYKVYAEVRGAGGLLRSTAVTDLLEPMMNLVPDPQFKKLVGWLDAHAEVLGGSRIMITGSPSRPNLPNVLVAVEFSSAEDAKKFYPELRGFLPTLLPTPIPTPTLAPSPTPSPAPAETPVSLPAPAAIPETRIEKSVVANEPMRMTIASPQNIGTVAVDQPPPAPPYQIKQVGTLVLLSDTAFSLRDLRPRNSKPLEEDQSFTLARNRLASESLFIYIDTKAIDQDERDRRKKYEEEEQKRIEFAAANPTPEPTPESLQTEITPPPAELPSPPPDSETAAVVVGPDTALHQDDSATLSNSPTPDNEVPIPSNYSFEQAFFAGESYWPDGIAVAVAFEGDAYVVRTLILNGDRKSNAIPFAPQFVSGPALVPQASNVFPADTDLFVTASLDYPQIYEGMVKAFANAEEVARKTNRRAGKEVPTLESPFTIYEKKLGLKIKDDLLPLLGNELAVALLKKAPVPAASPDPSSEKTSAETTGPMGVRPAEPVPVIAIAIKDREAVARLLPKLIESLGFKGANMFAQTEKREGTELTSYANLFAYAFVGDFLVVSPDAAATRQVVESYLAHETLSSAGHFRNFTGWQPHQVLGQAYVPPRLIQQFIFGTRSAANSNVFEESSGQNPVIEPVTYALSNDGQGPLHELHVPRNLIVSMFAGASSGTSRGSLQANEYTATSMLRLVAAAEATFQSTKGNGRYGTFDELASAGLIDAVIIQSSGYAIQINASENKFEAFALPMEYGKTGRLSYFIDESGVLRAGDHGGAAATSSDQPVE